MIYFTEPFVNLYDGAGDDSGDDAGAGAGAGAGDDTAVHSDPNARFTTEQVNNIVQERLAKDRAKRESEAQAKAKQLEKSYQDLLASQSLSQDERAALEQQLEDLQKQSRTKEEQAKHEKKQLKEQLEADLQAHKAEAEKWKNMHEQFVLETSLLDAAVRHDAFMPQQIQAVLQRYTKLVEGKDENGTPTGKLVAVVDLPDTDADTGKPIITQHDPNGAVERLKELQPNLFKANIVSGVGGNSSTDGVQSGADGRIDASSLTTEQFMSVLKKNPEKLGLTRRKPVA